MELHNKGWSNKEIVTFLNLNGIRRRNKKDNYTIKDVWVCIQKLKKSKLFDQIIVSTDNKKIAKISKKNGAEIPFKRPKNLSDDYTPGTSVISHSVRFLINKGYNFDYVCCVYATNTFLKVSDIKKGFKNR